MRLFSLNTGQNTGIFFTGERKVLYMSIAAPTNAPIQLPKVDTPLADFQKATAERARDLAEAAKKNPELEKDIKEFYGAVKALNFPLTPKSGPYQYLEPMLGSAAVAWDALMAVQNPLYAVIGTSVALGANYSTEQALTKIQEIQQKYAGKGFFDSTKIIISIPEPVQKDRAPVDKAYIFTQLSDTPVGQIPLTDAEKQSILSGLFISSSSYPDKYLFKLDYNAQSRENILKALKSLIPGKSDDEYNAYTDTLMTVFKKKYDAISPTKLIEYARANLNDMPIVSRAGGDSFIDRTFQFEIRDNISTQRNFTQGRSIAFNPSVVPQSIQDKISLSEILNFKPVKQEIIDAFLQENNIPKEYTDNIKDALFNVNANLYTLKPVFQKATKAETIAAIAEVLQKITGRLLVGFALIDHSLSVVNLSDDHKGLIKERLFDEKQSNGNLILKDEFSDPHSIPSIVGILDQLPLYPNIETGELVQIFNTIRTTPGLTPDQQAQIAHLSQLENVLFTNISGKLQLKPAFTSGNIETNIQNHLNTLRLTGPTGSLMQFDKISAIVARNIATFIQNKKTRVILPELQKIPNAIQATVYGKQVNETQSKNLSVNLGSQIDIKYNIEVAHTAFRALFEQPAFKRIKIDTDHHTVIAPIGMSSEEKVAVQYLTHVLGNQYVLDSAHYKALPEQNRMLSVFDTNDEVLKGLLQNATFLSVFLEGKDIYKDGKVDSEKVRLALKAYYENEGKLSGLSKNIDAYHLAVQSMEKMSPSDLAKSLRAKLARLQGPENAVLRERVEQSLMQLEVASSIKSRDADAYLSAQQGKMMIETVQAKIQGVSQGEITSAHIQKLLNPPTWLERQFTWGDNVGDLVKAKGNADAAIIVMQGYAQHVLKEEYPKLMMQELSSAMGKQKSALFNEHTLLQGRENGLIGQYGSYEQAVASLQGKAKQSLIEIHTQKESIALKLKNTESMLAQVESMRSAQGAVSRIIFEENNRGITLSAEGKAQLKKDIDSMNVDGKGVWAWLSSALNAKTPLSDQDLTDIFTAQIKIGSAGVMSMANAAMTTVLPSTGEIQGVYEQVLQREYGVSGTALGDKLISTRAHLSEKEQKLDAVLRAYFTKGEKIPGVNENQFFEHLASTINSNNVRIGNLERNSSGVAQAIKDFEKSQQPGGMFDFSRIDPQYTDFAKIALLVWIIQNPTNAMYGMGALWAGMGVMGAKNPGDLIEKLANMGVEAVKVGASTLSLEPTNKLNATGQEKIIGYEALSDTGENKDTWALTLMGNIPLPELTKWLSANGVTPNTPAELDKLAQGKLFQGSSAPAYDPVLKKLCVPGNGKESLLGLALRYNNIAQSAGLTEAQMESAFAKTLAIRGGVDASGKLNSMQTARQEGYFKLYNQDQQNSGMTFNYWRARYLEIEKTPGEKIGSATQKTIDRAKELFGDLKALGLGVVEEVGGIFGNLYIQARNASFDYLSYTGSDGLPHWFMMPDKNDKQGFEFILDTKEGAMKVIPKRAGEMGLTQEIILPGVRTLQDAVNLLGFGGSLAWQAKDMPKFTKDSPQEREFNEIQRSLDMSSEALGSAIDLRSRDSRWMATVGIDALQRFTSRIPFVVPWGPPDPHNGRQYDTTKGGMGLLTFAQKSAEQEIARLLNNGEIAQAKGVAQDYQKGVYEIMKTLIKYENGFLGGHANTPWPTANDFFTQYLPKNKEERKKFILYQGNLDGRNLEGNPIWYDSFTVLDQTAVNTLRDDTIKLGLTSSRVIIKDDTLAFFKALEQSFDRNRPVSGTAIGVNNFNTHMLGGKRFDKEGKWEFTGQVMLVYKEFLTSAIDPITRLRYVSSEYEPYKKYLEQSIAEYMNDQAIDTRLTVKELRDKLQFYVPGKEYKKTILGNNVL